MQVSSTSWYRNRRYLHFDRPVGLKKASRVVKSPKNVAAHAFYPLIGYEVHKKKIEKDRSSGTISIKFKPRPIKYAAHMDSHIYAYYAEKLNCLYEKELKRRGLDNCILAFRSLGKSNIDFAADVFSTIRKRGDCGVVALDISSFFDNLNHEILKSQLCGLFGTGTLPPDYFQVYKSITKYSFVDKDKLFSRFNISTNNPRKNRFRICSPKEFRENVRGEGLIFRNEADYGIPQGSPISALLSNIYMLDFDLCVSDAVTELGGEYYRYCDDMLFVVPNDFRDGIAGFVRTEIRKLKIDINTDKTELVRFKYEGEYLVADKPLQYLGFTFDGQRTLIRSAALARYSDRMKRGVKLASSTRHKINKVRSKRGLSERKIYRRKLYSRYSHLGKRNFVTYGHRAAKTFQSLAIRRQLKPLWKRLQDEIDKYK